MRPHINGLRSGSGSAPPETATNAETRLRAKRLSPDEDESRAGKTEVENEKRHLLLYIIPISNLNRFYEETRTAHFHRLHGGGGGIAASAQEVSQQKLDSLNQALSDMSARVKETEAAESNRAIWKDRSKYFNLNYVNQKLSPDIDGWDKLGGGELKSDFGAAIVWGKTYYLHKKPLAGMIKFGIDWSWMDLNYAQYKLETYDYDTDELYSEKAHQLEYGMQIGPSVTINPVHHLKVSAYFRVTPSYSMMYLNDEFYHHYATFCNTGFAVAWKVLSVGCEWRWGKASYDGLGLNLDDLEGDYSDGDFSGDIPSADDVLTDLQDLKLKTKSFRVYFSFRF